MTKFRPRYTKPRAGRPGLLSSPCSSVAAILKRSARGRRVKPQAVIVAQQRKWQLEKFSRTGTLFLLLVVAFGVGGWYCYQVLDSSDIFRLTTISVQGNRMTQKAQVLDLGGIEQGISLLDFDIDIAEERISSHLWIERAEISRSWPSTLEVRVHEYQPLAMVNIDNETGRTLYYVDHRGKVFAPVDNSQDLDFPVITGIESAGTLTGTIIADEGLATEAFRFLHLAAQGNPIVPLQTISEIHVSPEKGIVVYLVDSPFPIYMGYDNITTRYYELVKLLERLYRKKKIKEIKEIRMDYYEDRILVAKLEP